METTTPRHPESVWDSHKSEIERLYCDENWSQKAVHEFMREMHGFCATKFQYESHFKKWKFRKNHSQATWAKIGDLVRQGGSSSVVKHNGRELSARKLQKGITRYKTGDTSTAANDPLSPGFELVLTDVSKPPPMRAQLSLVYVTPSISLMRLFSIRNDFLPHPRGTQNKFPGTITILDTEFTKDLTYELPELAKSHHPSINLRAILPLSTLGSSEAAPDGTTSPASQAQDISLARGYSVELHVLIHALSNNMTSRLGFQNLGQVWRCVRNNHSLGTQEVLTYTLRSTYSKDLCHTIVQAAIEAGDAAGVRQLIRMWSINVDDVTCYGTNREAFSVVELAAGLVHSDVLAVLLDEGADINKTGAYSSRKLGKATGGAIYWLVYSAELTGLFHTPSTDSDQCSETSPKYVFRDSSSWTENALGVIQHLASTQVCHPALVEALRQNIYIAPFFETAWTAEELGQLYSHTKNTHLFWLFKKSVIMSIGNNQEHNLDVVKWCVPATTTEQAANKKPPLVDPSALLRRTVNVIHKRVDHPSEWTTFWDLNTLEGLYLALTERALEGAYAGVHRRRSGIAATSGANLSASTRGRAGGYYEYRSDGSPDRKIER
ncbi:Clr5 domain-containing protein [Microdochium nivale]|nr:Clr5 domain-containing protein [Microdochium nivale]